MDPPNDSSVGATPTSMFYGTYMYLVGGFNPSEKYDFVNWDDDIPNIWKVTKLMFQTTNQVLITIEFMGFIDQLPTGAQLVGYA